MEKVVCINNIANKNENYTMCLTLGKIYDVIEKERHYDFTAYKILDDKGYMRSYFSKYFKKISDIRNEKIDNILNGN